jgi:hypothetical protein
MKTLVISIILSLLLGFSGCSRTGTEANPVDLDSSELQKVQLTLNKDWGLFGSIAAYNGSEYIIVSSDISIAVDGKSREFRCKAGTWGGASSGSSVFTYEPIQPKTEGYLDLKIGSLADDIINRKDKNSKVIWSIVNIKGYKK